MSCAGRRIKSGPKSTRKRRKISPMVKTGKKNIFAGGGLLGALFVSFALGFFASARASADVSVTATVDRNEVSAGEAVVLTISVASSESLVVGDQTLPQLDGFDLVNQFAGR